MSTISSINKALFGLALAAALFAGSAAVAGEIIPETNPTVERALDNPGPMMGSDGKRYNEYSEHQTAEMLDAINRDHPVETPF